MSNVQYCHKGLYDSSIKPLLEKGGVMCAIGARPGSFGPHVGEPSPPPYAPEGGCRGSSVPYLPDLVMNDARIFAERILYLLWPPRPLKKYGGGFIVFG